MTSTEQNNPTGIMNATETTLGERFKELRERKGLTRLEVADRAGVKSDWVGRIERGDVTPTQVTWQKLCGAIGVEMFELLGIDESDLYRHALKQKIDRFTMKQLILVSSIINALEWE